MFVTGDRIELDSEPDYHCSVQLCNFHLHLLLCCHLSVRFDYAQLVHCSEHFDDFVFDDEIAVAVVAAAVAADAAVVVAVVLLAFVVAFVHVLLVDD